MPQTVYTTSTLDFLHQVAVEDNSTLSLNLCRSVVAADGEWSAYPRGVQLLPTTSLKPGDLIVAKVSPGITYLISVLEFQCDRCRFQPND